MTLPLVIAPGSSGHITHHEEIHGFLAPIASPFTIAQDADGTFAARPAAGEEGRYYFATDTGVLYRDSGSSWGAVHDMLKTWAVSLLTSGNNIATLTVPSCRATKAVAQTIPNASTTAVTMDGEEYDNDGMHSIASLTSRITANRAGIYLVTGGVVWAVGGTTSTTTIVRYAAIRRSGTTTYPGVRWRGTGGSIPHSAAAATAKLGVGDYVELVVESENSPAQSIDVVSGELAATFVSSA